MSVQKSYIERYNKVLRGFLFTVTIFYNVNMARSSADSALCGSQGDERCNAAGWSCHWVHFWCLFLILAVNFEVSVTGCIDCVTIGFEMQQQWGVCYSPSDCVWMGASPGMPSYWLYTFMQGSVNVIAKSVMRLWHQHCHSCAVNGLQLYVLLIKFSGIFNLVTFRVFCAHVYVLYFMMCSTLCSLS